MEGLQWLALLASLGAGAGCGRAAFACSEDTGCGDEGRCEADGWCSFPDPACASNRRYGELSGGGLAGACVAEGPGGGSTGSALTTTVGSTALDASGQASDTTGSSGTSNPVNMEGSSSGQPGSTGCVGAACDPSTETTDTAETTAETTDATTTGEPPCSGVFDDFDDDQIGAEWSLYGDAGANAPMMSEADGALRWAFSPAVVGQRGIWQPLDAAAARVRVHATELTQLDGGQAQSVLLFREDGDLDDIVLVFSGGRVEVRHGTTDVGMSPVFDWVEMRFEGDQVVVSSSSDGETFSEVVSVAGSYGRGLQTVWLYGQTWTEAPAEATAAFGSVEVCLGP